MIIVSHRGNLLGPDPERENTLEAINLALTSGFYVEVDVWYVDNKWYLGHDYPKIEFSIWDFSDKKLKKIIFHCKNFAAMEQLIAENENALYEAPLVIYFWHHVDNATLLSDGTPWTYPGYILKGGIACEPNMKEFNSAYKDVKGICTDYAVDLRESLPI